MWASGIVKDIFTETESSRLTQSTISATFSMVQNIFTADKSIPIKSMREVSVMISEKDMALDTHKSMSMKDYSTSIFNSERELFAMETFTKARLRTIKFTLFVYLALIIRAADFMILKHIYYTRIRCNSVTANSSGQTQYVGLQVSMRKDSLLENSKTEK
jgi:hypothetical protein